MQSPYRSCGKQANAGGVKKRVMGTEVLGKMLIVIDGHWVNSFVRIVVAGQEGLDPPSLLR
jgi:hypothetical protein